MHKVKRPGGTGFLLLVLSLVFLGQSAWAQGLPLGEDTPGAIIRVKIHDLQVQGVQTPEAVREGMTAILPEVVNCFQAEYERAGKVPFRVMLRFNLSSSGKVVWSKVIDPPQKSLDACISKALGQIKLPPSGSSLTRVTVMLEAKLDHLLAP